MTSDPLENTIRIYANQIQVLTLRNAELEDQLHQRDGQAAVELSRAAAAAGPNRTWTSTSRSTRASNCPSTPC